MKAVLAAAFLLRKNMGLPDRKFWSQKFLLQFFSQQKQLWRIFIYDERFMT